MAILVSFFFFCVSSVVLRSSACVLLCVCCCADCRSDVCVLFLSSSLALLVMLLVWFGLFLSWWCGDCLSDVVFCVFAFLIDSSYVSPNLNLHVFGLCALFVSVFLCFRLG